MHPRGCLRVSLIDPVAPGQMSFAELECELESVGNVALSVHDEGSRLANVCQDLLNRLSCGTQLK